MTKSSFGEKLRERRIEAGLTQDELGGKIGVKRNAISSWERDQHRPTFESMSKLNNFLDSKDFAASQADRDENWDYEHEVLRERARKIGANIRKARKRAGLYQAELADKLGISTKGLAHYERGRRTPMLGRLCNIGRALGVTPYFLMHSRQDDPEFRLDMSKYKQS